MTVYNKLVRDRIPSIICERGQLPRTRRVGDVEFKERLQEKLLEEVGEYLESGEPLELADVLEVAEALAREDGVSWRQLLAMKRKKRIQRGGFDRKIVLLEVTS